MSVCTTSIALPLIPVLIPLIVDLANGDDPSNNIVVR